MALPGNVGHGTVTGHFVDNSGALIEGTVTFTPSPKRLLNATATPPATILPRPVTVTLNEGSFTQVLIATDDEDNNPHNWTYRVDFKFTGVAAESIAGIEVPEGSTVDLTTVTPVGQGNGTIIVRGEGVPEGGEDGQVLTVVAGVPTWADSSGGPGGGTDLTTYSQVSGLADYPDTFPPDLSGVGPGDIGAQPAGSYATGAQGALADTAVQPGDLPTLADVATTGSYDDLTGAPTIPTQPSDIGAQPAGSYATAAQGAKADTAVQPAAIADFITAEDVPAAPTWGTISGKPAVIAAGTSQTAARDAIGAGTSNLQLGTGPTTAKAGDYTPSVADVPNLPASKVTSGTLDAARIPTLAQSKVTSLEADLAAKLPQPNGAGEVTIGTNVYNLLHVKHAGDPIPAGLLPCVVINIPDED